jgi:hypothetical protein
MRYYITEGDIDMIIDEWHDEWRIPTIPREVPTQTTKGGAPQVETQPQKIPIPKKPRTGQIKSTKAKGGSE